MNSCVYILKSLKNGRFYIGSTIDFVRRIEEHNQGKSKYTKNSGPYEQVFIQEYETLFKARKVERWVKTQKSRQLVEEIIKDGWIKKKF
jgi:putative endonuclease